MRRCSRASLLGLLFLPVLGCGRIGFDPGSSSQQNLCVYPPVGTCAERPGADLGSAMGLGVATGSTAGASTMIGGSCTGSAEEHGFAWVAPFDGTFAFSTVGSSYDAAIFARLGYCEGPEITCAAEGAPSEIRLPLIAGDRVILVIAGVGGGDAGDYVLNISRTEVGHCADGVDNDGDGRTDCADPMCDASIRCREVGRCSDGTDSDGDGAVDCNDLDCACDRSCLSCATQDLGAETGLSVASGVFAEACDEVSIPCNSTAQPDALFLWTPSRTGRYRIDTDGSPAGASLALFEGGTCDGAVVACNNRDDDGDGEARLRMDLTGDETYMIAVSSRGSLGDFVLNIEPDEKGACGNGADDDGDGAIDCADPDCAAELTCIEGGLCTNMLDDDGDGATDCMDSDCVDDSACTGMAVPGCPAMDLGSAVGGVLTMGSTERGTNSVECEGFTAGPDMGFLWTAPADGAYRVAVTGEYDVILHVRLGSCTGPIVGCDDRDDAITYWLQAGQQLVIFVDSHEGDSGAFEVHVDQAETLCEDGTDDDGDGDVDCADSDCWALSRCGERGRCENGEDDDADGDVDCADSECRCDPICVTRSCPDEDLGERMGTAVATGVTSQSERCGGFLSSCKSSEAPERTYLWRAPSSGTFRFDSAGSDFATIVYLLEGGCEGRELACNQASPESAGGIVNVTLEKGDEIVVVVDGQHGDEGNLQLNITTSEQGRCGNGVDDDGDGLADCLDAECASDLFCCGEEAAACVCL